MAGVEGRKRDGVPSPPARKKVDVEMVNFWPDVYGLEYSRGWECLTHRENSAGV